jgi:cytochrome c oxidase subunit 2
MFDIFKYISLDAPTPWGLFFQDSASPQMEGIEELHNNIMFYLVIVLFTVTWMMVTIIKTFISTNSLISHKYMNHGRYVPIQKSSKIKNLLIYS